MNIWSIIGLIIVTYVAYDFVRSLGKSLPLLELLLLIAGMQWIVGAFIEYRTDFQHYKYYMYVGEMVYMSYVVPAFAVLVLAIKLFKINGLFLEGISFDKFSTFGLVLVAIGFLADFVVSSVPGSLKFVFYLLANFKYVGAIILSFSSKKFHRYVFYGSIILLMYFSLRGGFFHEFIIWSVFFYMFWSYKKKTTFRFNLVVIILGFFISTVIQAVKLEYRASLWSGYSGNYASLFLDILNKRLSGGLAEDLDQQEELNVRLNQGWIISAIMEHTPRVEPYANGKTIKEALFASALPRFLNPEKKIAGGVENFEKFTGIELLGSTSMGMSLVGEGYANFGNIGGIFFMGFWGIFLAWFWRFITKRIQEEEVLLFFLPLVFLQVVKAETELVVVLNHLVKATILVLLFVWFVKKVTSLKFKNE